MSTRREAALIRLGDLRVRQGRLEDAAQLLTGLEAHPDAARALAGLYFARARDRPRPELLERATAGPDDSGSRGRRVDDDRPAARAARRCPPRGGDIDAAARAAARLRRIADAQGSAYLRAAAALAEGQVCIASGTGDARACLQDALDGFVRAQMPMELACTRLAMARSLAETLT